MRNDRSIESCIKNVGEHFGPASRARIERRERYLSSGRIRCWSRELMLPIDARHTGSLQRGCISSKRHILSEKTTSTCSFNAGHAHRRSLRSFFDALSDSLEVPSAAMSESTWGRNCHLLFEGRSPFPCYPPATVSPMLSESDGMKSALSTELRTGQSAPKSGIVPIPKGW